MSKIPSQLSTAGKITILTSLIAVGVFMVVFLLNLGADELQEVRAQGTATTTITVLNTPPQWTVDAQEQFGSSTSTPTNSGDNVTWVATATDSNSAPYFLLICSTNASPTPNAANDLGSLGTEPPDCDGAATQWGVSASTTSGSQASVTYTALPGDAELNVWYAWVCDDDPVNPRCNNDVQQGSGTTSSPFVVNHRPTFSAYSDDSPADPGALVTFTATADDPDVEGGDDTVRLYVCSTNSFSIATESCDATELASSTLSVSDPTATYTIAIPTRDQNYAAFGFVVDEHGHAATGGSQGTDSVLTVNNVAPYVNAGDVTLNDGGDIVLTVAEGETAGFELQFAASDNNSCENASAGDEIVDWNVSVYRTTVGSSSCAVAGDYDANSCYTSEVPTGTWNISCTASSTSCTGPTDLNVVYDCSFPLWYIADPTDGSATNTVHFATDWSAAVAAIDDNAATGTLAAGQAPNGRQELTSFLSIALDTLAIPYGALEPGQRTDPLVASTTLRATGNVGLDQLLTGESMCTTYTSSVTCPNSASSTIAALNQVFATSTVSYAAAQGDGFILSSTTQNELEINIPKSTATSSQSSGETYWGIEVPLAITLAGAYTGENTFFGRVGEPVEW